ncbi:hypothetical protein [Alicyclobacillus dauci]|uniref:GyrI-like small molecule binding domain-containing protein n=1 Tax=Alicyclobacillus dauci TaxID=1475485 RepID=A0ABY6Z3M5_9BACL|nr:hypothetical protein [Alicyclobacillus dauci]WAH37442.1 hypothetical protein NZD86_02565 [Alicyclobacillus dauci]
MKYRGEPSWSVVTEGTEDLNFAIYLACTYDLLPKSKPFSGSKRWTSTTPSIELAQAEKTVLSNGWVEWWSELVAARSAQGHNFEFYAPSYFDSLAKELGDVCRNTWKPFREWWHMPAGGKTAMIHWESADNVGQYVRDFEQHINRKARPFRLKVDLVYAGLDDLIEVNDEYVIMPIRSPRENQAWWTQKITAIG